MIVAERIGAIVALTGAMLLAGCQAGDTGNAAAPTPQPTATTVALPSPAPSPLVALEVYAGHYPFDAVGGVRFLDQPAVVRAVTPLVPDARIRALVLGGDGPGTPIALQAGKLVAWGCETHNCGDHDWTISIAPDGGAASVCYHDAATMQEKARWYLAPGRTEMRDGDCPSDS
jgi:hypothetical protein